MDDAAPGFNSFLKYCGPHKASLYVTFDASKKSYLHSTPIPAPDYIVGPGTVCYATSKSESEPASAVIKLSWRDTQEFNELNVLTRIYKHDVPGISGLVAVEDNLETIEDLHKGLRLPGTSPNLAQSCIAISPLGLLLQEFATISELLDILADAAEALQSFTSKREFFIETSPSRISSESPIRIPNNVEFKVC